MPSMMPMEASSFLTPKDIGGVDGWWEADSITGLADAENITAWSDSSSAGNNLTAPANVPTYRTNVINGFPVARFVKASTQGLRADTIQAAQIPITFAAVVNLVSLTSGNTIFGSSNGNGLNYQVAATGALRFAINNASFHSLSTTLLSITTWYVVVST